MSRILKCPQNEKENMIPPPPHTHTYTCLFTDVDVYFQSFQCSKKAWKFPCPALNACVRNHCDHRDKERNLMTISLFLKSSVFQTMSLFAFHHTSYIDYMIVIYIFIVLWCLSVRGCWVNASWDGLGAHELTLTRTLNPKMCSSSIVSKYPRHIYRKPHCDLSYMCIQ